jgi:hypothetical protein
MDGSDGHLGEIEDAASFVGYMSKQMLQAFFELAGGFLDKCG